MAEQKDLYALLGVAKTATEDEIKAAHKKLSMKCHPDRLLSKSEDEQKAGAKMFSEITEARDILMDAAKRRAYDVGGYSAVKNMGNGNSNRQGSSVQVNHVPRHSSEEDVMRYFGVRGDGFSTPKKSTTPSSDTSSSTGSTPRKRTTLAERMAALNGGNSTSRPSAPSSPAEKQEKAPPAQTPVVSRVAQMAFNQVAAALEKLAGVSENDLSTLSPDALNQLSEKLDAAKKRAGSAAQRKNG